MIMFKSNKNGFTLIELMIALAVGSIVIAAIYAVFESQVRGQVSQTVMTDMQEGLRSALEIMEKDLRTAASDPLLAAGAGFVLATNTQMRFTMDITGSPGPIPPLNAPDGDTNDPNENITYALTGTTLGRADNNVSATLQPIAYNIDALNFVYLDANGVRLATPLSAANLALIDTIQITIVARSGAQLAGFLKHYRDTTTYRNQQNDVILSARNDNFRRLMLTTTIFCRNL